MKLSGNSMIITIMIVMMMMLPWLIEADWP